MPPRLPGRANHPCWTVEVFPRERAVIVNADAARAIKPRIWSGGSINDAQVSSDIHALRTLHCISAEYPGERPGTALRTILASADSYVPPLAGRLARIHHH